MIGIFLGEQNSGKTLSMTYWAYRYFKQGYDIYSNYNLKFKHNKLNKSIIEEYTIGQKQFNKAIFLVDEIYLFLDARQFGRKSNRIFSYFLLQTSKRNVHLFGTAQLFNTVEKRFRENCNFQVYCSRVLNRLGKWYNVTSNLRLLKGLDDFLYIKCNFMIKRLHEGLIADYKLKTYYLKARPIYELYDTRQLLAID